LLKTLKQTRDPTALADPGELPLDPRRRNMVGSIYDSIVLLIAKFKPLLIIACDTENVTKTSKLSTDSNSTILPWRVAGFSDWSNTRCLALMQCSPP
jgi:hypothetical protein